MPTTPQNEQQATYWTQIGGPRWVEQQRMFDHMLSNFGQESVRVLDAQPGERILDVGCGTATTTRMIGDAVGDTGHVHGVDISQTMIDAARVGAASCAQITFSVADAQTDSLKHDEADPPFDAVYSRFGVMFFADPVMAFANVASSVRRGGRMVFACWQGEASNEWMSSPAAEMRRFTPEPVLPPPNAPGPFGFANGNRVRDILQQAGWAHIDLRGFTAPTVLGVGVDEAVTQALSSNAGLTMRGQVDDETYARAVAAVRELLAGHLVDGSVVFDGNVWIVSARKP